MLIELVAAVGAVGVAALSSFRLARRKRDGTQANPPEVSRANPAWHLLRSDEESADAIDRAILCEQASIAVLDERAKHFAAMKARSAPAHPASVVSANDPAPRPDPRAQPRAS